MPFQAPPTKRSAGSFSNRLGVGFPLLGILLATLSGCGGFDPSRAWDLEELGSPEDVELVAVGSGPTRQAAEQVARQGLAHQVWTKVRSRQSSKQIKNGDEVDKEFSSAVESYSRVDLFSVRELKAVKKGGSYHVALGLPAEQVEAARERVKRKAPVFAVLHGLRSLGEEDLFQRVERAIEGLEKSHERDILADQFTLDGRLTTFESAFKGAIRKAAETIEVLAVREEGGPVTIRAIDRETRFPLSGLPLKVGEAQVRTTEEGRAELPEDTPQGEKLTVTLGVSFDSLKEAEVLQESDLRVGSVQFPEEEVQTIKFHVQTDPTGVPVQIYRDGSLLKDAETPFMANLRAGEDYSVRVVDTERVVGKELDTITVDSHTPHYYLYRKLEKKFYGHMDLRAQGGARIEVRDEEAGTPMLNRQGRAQERMATGSYQVTVRHNGEDYQRLQDTVRVRKGETVRRSYRAPQYRDPYLHGWRAGLTLSTPGRRLRDEYEVPGGKMADYRRDRDLDLEGHSGIGLEGAYYADFLNLAFQGGIKYYDGSALMESGTGELEDHGRLTIGGAEAALGFHHLWEDDGPLYVDGAWVVGGRAWEWTEWKSRDGYELPRGRSAYGYQFVEMGMDVGLFKLAVRLPDSGVDPHLEVGLSYLVTSSGYELPDPSVQAVRGLHYEVPEGEGSP